MEWIVAALLGALAGVSGWLLGRASQARRIREMLVERDQLRQQLTVEQVSREVESRSAEQRLGELKELKAKFESTFKALSADALQSSSEQFLKLAQENFSRYQVRASGDLEKRQQAISELVAPIRKSLEQVDDKIEKLERAREGAYAGLQEQIRNLLETQNRLQSETSNLVFALKTPNVRGRWGELQLERTVEFAGMTEHVDFVQQASTEGETGRLRPDLLVKLPGGKHIIVDAKAPLDAYLRAVETDDGDERLRLLKDHARQIRDHIKAMGTKAYWRQFDPTPEFVVIFLPGEAFFSAALEQDPDLIQYGSGENVLLATPTTLIALLKAAAYGWRQEAIAEQAREISLLGRELYERLAVQSGHYADVGRSLKRSVESYNKSIRSLETRVMVTARKFESLANGGRKRLADLDPIEEIPVEPGSG